MLLFCFGLTSWRLLPLSQCIGLFGFDNVGYYCFLVGFDDPCLQRSIQRRQASRERARVFIQSNYYICEPRNARYIEIYHYTLQSMECVSLVSSQIHFNQSRDVCSKFVPNMFNDFINCIPLHHLIIIPIAVQDHHILVLPRIPVKRV